jgi:hypothetical protein
VKLTLLEWLTERYDNCVRIAAIKEYTDCAGWLEDADYFKRAILAIEALGRLRHEI